MSWLITRKYPPRMIAATLEEFRTQAEAEQALAQRDDRDELEVIESDSITVIWGLR